VPDTPRPLDALLDAARAYAAAAAAAPPVSVTVRFADGSRVTHHLPPGAGPAPAAPPCSHSPDFRAAVWHGAWYTFTPEQARVVERLWAAWEAGAPASLGQDGLLAEAGSEAGSVAALFAGSPALGTLVVEAGRRKFRLAPPPG
jgi:hypothetical protein